MKRVIRRNIFETDSSSMHSIVVMNNGEYVKPEDEYCYVNNGELWLKDVQYGFGRHPFKMLTTFIDKLEYAMCEILGGLYEDDPEWEKKYNEFKDIAASLIPDFKDFDIPTKDVDTYVDKNGDHIMQKDLHYDHWEDGIPIYYYLDENGEKQIAELDKEYYMEMPDIGMIDHQSAGLLTGFLRDKGISLEEFLTSTKYVVVIDGDEYYDFQRYLTRGLIDRSAIEEIY